MPAFTQANFLALIRSAEGTPYLFGGTDPFHGGADCSGLIYWAALQCGVTLPRTTEAEWAGLPHSADWRNAPVGSIVEFDVPSDGAAQPAHVGVVIGNGVMIDDPHTGAVVRQEAIPTVPGVIWPMGYCTLPFVIDPTPSPPKPPIPNPLPQEFHNMADIAISADGSTVAGVRTDGHLIVAKGGPTAADWNNASISDITDRGQATNPNGGPWTFPTT